MIDKEISRGELVELMADKRLPVEMPFSAVYYSDRAVSTRIRAFIDFLSDAGLLSTWQDPRKLASRVACACATREARFKTER
jgi:hypothetical protein